MSANIHTISLPREQEDFLNDNPDVSLSKITQTALSELIERTKITAETLREANRKVQVWHDIAEQARVFIEKQGLLDKWLEERGQN